MNNVILFESVDSSYYGIYNLESQYLYDSEGNTINDIDHVLYGRCTHLIWNKAYKDMCLEECRCNGLDYLVVPNRRDSIVAYSLENSYSIIIEFA